MQYPDALLQIPPALKTVSEPADWEQVAKADAIRAEYLLPGLPNPYMVDIARAFRLATGAQIYIEVGTQDKGNIAWLARTKLAPGATIVDIDFVDYPENDRKIAAELDGRFDYHAIRGDCLSAETVTRVRAILGDRKADLIFCDSHYTYAHTISEFSLYYPLVKDGGFLFFHDAQWPGDPSLPGEEGEKGKGLAIEQLDRFYPVYAVVGPDTPVYRYIPPASRAGFWGTVAIIPR
jgi:cephalosporin hydroxylase